MAITNRDLPAGTELTASYKKQTYICTVEAGKEGQQESTTRSGGDHDVAGVDIEPVPVRVRARYRGAQLRDTQRHGVAQNAVVQRVLRRRADGGWGAGARLACRQVDQVAVSALAFRGGQPHVHHIERRNPGPQCNAHASNARTPPHRSVMPMDDDHYAVNRAYWDERAPAHAGSVDYAVQEIIADPTRLSDVIRLGGVNGLRGIHLQCHIGTDTISLHRLGAAMTGLDFSADSIAIARRLAADARADVAFVESDVYSAPIVVGDGFDFVFTGIGALCWLPDIQRWARIVADLLRPGGRLFLREGHPMLWAVDEGRTDALVLGYPYFEQPEPMHFDVPGTYVDTAFEFGHNQARYWSHGLGEIVNAVLEAGLELTMLVEHDSVPWEALPGRMRREDGEWRLIEHPEWLPLSYTLQAVKR